MYKDRRPKTLTTWRLSNSSSELGNAGIQLGNYDAPKSKFLYTVSFVTSLDYAVDQGNEDMGLNIYPCKTVTRPNIAINYVDVNSYNYRFKVATRTEYGTVTVAFYDDNKNTAHTLLRSYLEIVSPIARKAAGDSYYLKNESLQFWASLGPLPTQDADGIIKSMRVTHHYNSGNKDIENYYSKIHYDYINPKIQTFNWDELDMGASDAPIISATFVYDSVNITEEHNEGFNDNVGTIGDFL